MALSSVRALQLVFTIGLAQYCTSQCFGDNYTQLQQNNQAHNELLNSQLLFSADLLRTAATNTSDNIFLSPNSVFNALLLAYFISANQTEDSLKKMLRIPPDQGIKHSSREFLDEYNSIIRSCMQIFGPAEGKDATFWAYSIEKYNQRLRSIKGVPQYRLSNANKMYFSNENNVQECFKQHFKDEIESFNPAKIVETIDKINSWVSKQTNDAIDKFLSPESLNENTNLILVNAAYFRGFWKNQFSPSQTQEEEFTLANGTTVPVMMMSLESQFNHSYDQKLGAEVLELQYGGDDISMFILLPLEVSPSAVANLIDKLDSETLQNITNRTNTSSQLDIKIPKFVVDASLELNPILSELGVGDLFESSADLSSLTGEPGLRLDTAVHKAKITIDETGSEAAAATAVFANRFGADSFIADHPFVFLLFDKTSNILLFAGVLNSPDK